VALAGLGLALTLAIAGGVSPAPSPAQTQAPTLVERADQLLGKHQLALGVAGAAVIGYLGVWWLRPRWLLRLPSKDITLPWTQWTIPLTLVKPLKYPNRVLDAWVEDHWQVARDQFLALDTVDNRILHIPLPVDLNGTTRPALQPEDLAPTFAKKPAILLITAEGGAGKTSWACQIAQWGLDKKLTQHRLIPLLIEKDLEEGVSLLETLRGRLGTLTGQGEPLPLDLVEKLLRRQRLLVIVDHLSEMEATTRKALNPDLPDFAAKALIITSRLEERDRLGSLPKTILKPLQIEPTQLSLFMVAYLKAKNLVGLLEDDDYFLGSDRLRRMTADKPITPLLACLYIDQMINERRGAGGILPDSVPRLMLSYLTQLNRAIEPANKREDRMVQRDAKAVAWACLQNTYRPNWINTEAAIAALARVEDNTAEARYGYLKDRLLFLQSPDPGDRTRVILDPLAEYLAAAYLVEQLSQQPDPGAAWEEFLSQTLPAKLAKTESDATQVKGFILALRDCCLDQSQDDDIPKDIADRLARTVDLNPDELRRIEDQRRIKRLIADLAEPNLDDRLRAAQVLSTYGIAARIAEPNLVGMLENRKQQPTEARQAAAETLGKLKIGHTALLSLLQDTEEDLEVRRRAALALGEMGVAQDTLLTLLNGDHQPFGLRQAASQALGLIGGPSGQPQPMLDLRLVEGQPVPRVISPVVWRESLPQDQTLELVEIPAGEFMMGSPEEEEGRDWYQNSSYVDTKGLNLEQQHRVSLPGFALGQHPVTQAQWRAVASLPAINYELNPDPAQFKGDHRPVEMVSWYEAVEFCDRLSQHTGKPYRLPSEAEWEYACRAGTPTPFYFGDTITTDLANYDGNYTYAGGPKGKYREQTTPVGQFGVNPWGLADMHGNVLEWCEDHWHPSYEGAPSDGSAWITDDANQLRLVRGGSWYNSPVYCRSAYRDRNNPNFRDDNLGFRVVCAPPGLL
jgi:formylglycine-generating enzyme required for sulfatase activity